MNTTVQPGAVGLPYRFSDERTVKFVELYGREPCLWNKRPYLRRARNAAYRRIQAGINADIEPYETSLTIQGVKMKIKNLRTGYHQELKKIRTISGYFPKTPWFAPLHGFLAEFLDTNDLEKEAPPQLKRLQIRLTRLKPIKIQAEIKPDPDEGSVPELPSFPTPSSLFTVLPAPMPMDEPPTPPPSLPKITEMNSAPPLPAPVQMPQPQSTACSLSEKSEIVGLGLGSSVTGKANGVGLGLGLRGEDEFTYFGLSVAAQIRNMPLDSAMVMQSKIQYMISMERRKINGHSGNVDIFN
ncbi:protein FAM222A [Drosophila eugracilis]|uniref:protein FAM222A n=1 Tax=Drosophila eugracilis TaxID=29029 RepID=UPI0007E72C5E|nr:protein FAM222A [Drosophila eugracilis]